MRLYRFILTIFILPWNMSYSGPPKPFGVELGVAYLDMQNLQRVYNALQEADPERVFELIELYVYAFQMAEEHPILVDGAYLERHMQRLQREMQAALEPAALTRSSMHWGRNAMIREREYQMERVTTISRLRDLRPWFLFHKAYLRLLMGVNWWVL